MQQFFFSSAGIWLVVGIMAVIIRVPGHEFENWAICMGLMLLSLIGAGVWRPLPSLKE